MLNLPLFGSYERSLFDVEHLAQVADPENRDKLATMAVSRSNARAQFEANACVTEILSFVWRADNTLQLIRFTREGGAITVWDFGTL